MKSVVYFILSVLVILYVGVLCTINICGAATVAAWGTIGTILLGVSSYGGIVIVFLYALVNFFGNPLKTVFFILLVLVLVLYILTLVIPGVFQSLFGIAQKIAT